MTQAEFCSVMLTSANLEYFHTKLWSNDIAALNLDFESKRFLLTSFLIRSCSSFPFRSSSCNCSYHNIFSSSSLAYMYKSNNWLNLQSTWVNKQQQTKHLWQTFSEIYFTRCSFSDSSLACFFLISSISSFCLLVSSSFNLVSSSSCSFFFANSRAFSSASFFSSFRSK